MSDLIRIVDLEVRTRIGVPEEERAEPQRLLVSLEMEVAGVAAAARTDDVGQTVDYGVVAERVRTFAQARVRKLVETLASELAEEILREFAVQRVRVEVKKFILPDTAHVAIEVERARATGPVGFNRS
jgi:dihydroneopterin aldolase